MSELLQREQQLYSPPAIIQLNLCISFMSLDSIDLSTPVKEDPSIMNEDLCATSEDHAVGSPCMTLTVDPTYRDMNKPPLPLPLVS